MRAHEAYGERYGNHYAAAITYFSVLSLVPLIMIAFAVAGFVLAGNDDLLAELRQGITESAPAGLGDTLNEVVAEAVESRGTVGVLGLLAAAYSGLGWMGNLRDALTAQWGQRKPQLALPRKLAADSLALLGLGLALVVSFGITAAGSGLGTLLLDLVGLADDDWALFFLRVGAVLLSLAANWLVFVWVISRLPRERVNARAAVRGALAGAIGFEILKQVGTIYLESVSESPTGALFGPIIGLLVFANLVSRFLLYITAWTATAGEQPAPEEAPGPVVIRPAVQVHPAPRLREAAGLVAAGALLGFVWRRGRRRE